MNSPAVFISYSHRDADLVSRVATDLRARAVNIWLDEWKLKPGMSLPDAVHKAIVGAHHVLLFVSSNFIRSKWCRAELDTAASAALARQRKRRLTLIPALVDDCKIPATISRFVYADFRGDYLRGLVKVLEVVDTPSPNTLDDWFSRALAALAPGDVPDYSVLTSEVSLLEEHWNFRFRASVPVPYLKVPTDDEPYRPRFVAKLDKWLGNTLRDYVCYRILVRLRELLEKEGSRPSTSTNLLDALFDIVQSTIRDFGLARSRDAEQALIDALDSLRPHLRQRPTQAVERTDTALSHGPAAHRP